MQCNIDARGKAVRLVLGLLNLTAALVLAGLLLSGVLTAWPWWIAVAALAIGGGFACFEARSGWCAVRAMGFSTPI